MNQQNKIQLFEQKQVRMLWDEDAEKWYFSIVDVVSILTDSVDGRKYWNKLKQRLKEEGNNKRLLISLNLWQTYGKYIHLEGGILELRLCS